MGLKFRDSDDLFYEISQRSAFVEAYYAVRRFLLYALNPFSICRRIKWFFQRGRRGWSENDVWGFESYLSRVILEGLYYLKENQNGFPIAPEIDENGNTTPESEKAALEKWNNIMDRMIAGFEAKRRMDRLDYGSILGKSPIRGNPGETKEEWKQRKNIYYAKMRELENKDRETLQEGLALFCQYFESLWD